MITSCDNTQKNAIPLNQAWRNSVFKKKRIGQKTALSNFLSTSLRKHELTGSKSQRKYVRNLSRLNRHPLWYISIRYCLNMPIVANISSIFNCYYYETIYFCIRIVIKRSEIEWINQKD